MASAVSLFLLIPGACHGAWCWRHLVPQFEAAGHRVLAPEPAGMGEDQTPLDLVGIGRWARDLVMQLAVEQEQAIVVAHSRGGMVASQLAELAPERVAASIYVSALMPLDGESAQTITALPELARIHSYSVHPTANGLAVTVDPADIRAFFYQRTPAERAEAAMALCGPEPLAALVEPVSLTAPRYGSVPRFCIECLDDAALPLSVQRFLQGRAGCDHVVSLASDHSPFFSCPEDLAAACLAITARIPTGVPETPASV